MKKLILLFITILLISCNGINNADPLLTNVIKNEIKHIDNYNKIRKISKDSNVNKYIDSLKINFKNDAIITKTILINKKGIIFGNLKESQNLLEEYIKKCN